MKNARAMWRSSKVQNKDVMFNVWHVLPFNNNNQFILRGLKETEKMHTQCYVQIKLKKNMACACWPWHGCRSQRFLKFPTFSLKFPDQLNNDGLNPPLAAIPCLKLFIYAFSKSRAVCIRVFHSIWKYQMNRFIWGTHTFCATGVYVEWWSQKLLGGGGGPGGIFPREILMIGLSKMQFPTFSWSQFIG